MIEPRKRVLLVDDHPVVREGIARLLEKHADLEVCGEAASQFDALRCISELQPDALLLDLALGHSDGLETIKQIRAFHPALPILVLSMYEEDQYAERAIRAGASGYAMKQQAPAEIIAALRLVLQGELALTPRMTTRLLREKIRLGSLRQRDDGTSALSDRELHVFSLIGSGLATRQIASDLCISPKTIETYRENIKVKLNLKNAEELVNAATKWVNRKP